MMFVITWITGMNQSLPDPFPTLGGGPPTTIAALHFAAQVAAPSKATSYAPESFDLVRGT